MLAEYLDLYVLDCVVFLDLVVVHLESIEFVDAEPEADTVEVDVDLYTKHLRKKH